MAKVTYLSKRTGYLTRTRICDKCGYRIQSIEISKESFQKDMEMLSDIKKIMQKHTVV
ncbi:MAG: hypothetical protein NT038_07925 [Euryarchaeota archaeon]|nr:hypothetical protein [Euryarchaeota archaeon]